MNSQRVAYIQPDNKLIYQAIESPRLNQNGSMKYLFDRNSDFFMQEYIPKNPYLPREQTTLSNPQFKKVQIHNENTNNQIQQTNQISYEELNQTLNHQDQAKINRAIAMGWLPTTEAERIRNDKSKQQLYRYELQKQIDEKQEEKKRIQQKQQLEEDKLEQKVRKQLNLPIQNQYNTEPPRIQEFQTKQVEQYPQNKTQSRLERTPPINSGRNNSFKVVYSQPNKDMKSSQMNNSSLNDLSIPNSNQHYLNKQFNKPLKSPINKAMNIIVSPNFERQERETYNFIEPQIQSMAQLSLHLMKKQMQESYLNASQQLDDLKVEMDMIKQSKRQAQQEYNQLRDDIRNQIQLHNLKMYGGLNFIKNPSKYYQVENMFVNNDSSMLQNLVSETTMDQNIFQYSQTLPSSAQRLSAIQSPDLMLMQAKPNQPVNISSLQTKEILASKLQTEQDILKIESLLNDSQLSNISKRQKNQSIKQSIRKQESQKNMQLLERISPLQSNHSLPKSVNQLVQNQDQSIISDKESQQKGSQIDLAESTVSINLPIFDIKRKSEEEIDKKQSLKSLKQLSKSNFNQETKNVEIDKKQSLKQIKEQSKSNQNSEIKKFSDQGLNNKTSLEIHKDIGIDAKRRQSLNSNINQKKQGDQQFKTLIKNIEKMVDEQGKDIDENNYQIKNKMNQELEFCKIPK